MVKIAKKRIRKDKKLAVYKLLDGVGKQIT